MCCIIESFNIQKFATYYFYTKNLVLQRPHFSIVVESKLFIFNTHFFDRVFFKSFYIVYTYYFPRSWVQRPLVPNKKCSQSLIDPFSILSPNITSIRCLVVTWKKDKPTKNFHIYSINKNSWNKICCIYNSWKKTKVETQMTVFTL